MPVSAKYLLAHAETQKFGAQSLRTSYFNSPFNGQQLLTIEGAVNLPFLQHGTKLIPV